MAEVKSGYIHKCGKSVRTWKRRWFVLKPNGYLYYYESKNSKIEKGKIDIVDACKVGEYKEVAGVEKKLPSGFSYDNAFGIISGDRTFTCVCESDGENLSWLSAIKEVRDAGGNMSYPEPTINKEEPSVAVKEALPTLEVPPSYTPDNNYGGSLHRHSSVHVPTSDPYVSSTMPRPHKAKDKPDAPRQRLKSAVEHKGPVVPPPLPSTNPYYSPQVAAAPPSANPQYRAPPPPNPQYRAPPPPNPQYQAPPNPQYRAPPPPNPQYRAPPPAIPQYGAPPPAPLQYPPRPQYLPQPQYQYQQQFPPQPQYRSPQPQYRPPQPQACYRPPVVQPQYRPQAQYRPPQPRVKYQPPAGRQGMVQSSTTTVVVTTVRK